MLNSTAIHADLAKRLLRFYPQLIHDIYLNDEYYGKLRIVVQRATIVGPELNCCDLKLLLYLIYEAYVSDCPRDIR